MQTDAQLKEFADDLRVALGAAISGMAGLSDEALLEVMADFEARLELGRKLRGAVPLGGGEGPAPFPAVARVLDEGVLGVEAAAAIVKQCTVLADRGCAPDVVALAEETLVDQTISCRLTADETFRAAIHLREVLDPDGAEPRDEVLQMQRSLTIAQSPDGMNRHGSSPCTTVCRI